MMIIGIDPGQTGGIAFIRDGVCLHLYDTPTEAIKKGKGIKNEYLPAHMAEILKTYGTTTSTHCYLEKVGAMPGQGVTSMFNFGKGYGLWIGILAALGIPYTLVTPQAWKKEIMQGVGDKDAARGRAQQLFPDMTHQLSRKKDIGRADALLIAEYGRRISK